MEPLPCKLMNHASKWELWQSDRLVGAVWVEDLFVKHVPCMEMDGLRRSMHTMCGDYPYFEATYLDNPVYATDPKFLKNLEAYPESFRDALKFAIWGAAGGYFHAACSMKQFMCFHATSW